MATNGECQKLHKTIVEICDIVKELKLYYEDSQTPITDDNPLLQRYLIKMEYLFQVDLQGKVSFLGTKRSYWDFLCKCLSGRRNTHDGVRYVKGISEIQTSEGRGRAFIRFCLMHHCLADSIQQCVLKQNFLKDWYGNNSPLRVEFQFSHLLASLYELNEIQFELNPLGRELDIGWPTMAKKSTEGYSWRMPSRTASVCSLSSSTSMFNDTSYEREMFSQNNNHASISENSNQEIDEDYPAIVQALVDQNSNLKQIMQQKETLWLEEKQKLEQELAETKNNLEEVNKEFSRQKKNVQEKAEIERNPQQVKQVKLLEKGITDLHAHSNGLLSSFQTKLNSVEDKIHELNKKFPVLSTADASCEEIVQIPVSSVKDFVDDVCSIQFGAQDLILSQKGFLEKINNLIKSNVDLHQVSMTLKYENEDLRNNLAEQKDKMTSHSTKSDVLGVTNKKMEEQIAALKDALQAAKEILVIKDMEMTKLQTELHRSKVEGNQGSGEENQSNETQKQTEDLLNKVHRLQEEKLDLNRALTNAVNKLSEFEKFSNVNVLKETEEQIKQLTDKLRRSMHLLDAQGTQISDLKEKLDASREENKILTMQMKTLNDLLQEVEKKEEVINPQVDNESDHNYEANSHSGQSKDDNCVGKKEANCGPTAIKVVSRTLSRLSSLIAEKKELQQQLKTTKEMTVTLLNRVAEQEQQLSEVTQELTETQKFIDKLRSAFSKLQTNEAILRHELREKRHLLNKLKEQLESSRVQWKQAQQKNCDSELQWQNLRDEFDSRRKEMGESSKKTILTSPSPDSSAAEPVNDFDGDCTGNSDLISAASLSPDDSNPLLPDEDDPRDRRLKFLEDQCRMLYEKILKSAKYGAALDMRLTSLHDHYGSGDTECSVSTPDDEQDISEESELEKNIATELEVEIENTDLTDVQVIVNDVVNDLIEKITDGVQTSDNYVLERNNSPEDMASSSAVKVSAYDMAHALPKRIEKLRKEKEDVQSKLQHVQRELKASELKKAKYKTSNNLLQSQNADLISQLKSTRDKENESLVHDKSQFDEIFKAKDFLQQKVLSIEKKLQERSETVLKVQEELNSAQQELELTRKSLQQEISALNFQLNTETLRYNNVFKERSEQTEKIKYLQECVNSQEVMIAQLETRLIENQTERENEQMLQWQQLEELKQTLARQEEEKLKSTSSILEVERQKNYDLQNELQMVNATVSQLHDKISELEADNEQLKKHIVKITKAKDLLWKQSHFLKCGKQTHELNRWIQSGDVTNCTSCNVEFSLLVRKHHCRLCGHVFCYNCSMNWLSTASSNQKVRTCNDCFHEYTATHENVLKVTENDSSDEDVQSDELSGEAIASERLNESEVTDEDLPISEEFHVVTEDEITESIDTSANQSTNDYTNWILNEVWTEDYLKHLTETSEIKTLNIAARKQYAIPVLIENPGNLLEWNFTSKTKNIDFYVIYYSLAEELLFSPGKVLLSPTRCQCDLHPVDGKLIPQKKGFYTFVFDNSFSKLTAKEILLAIRLR